MDRTSGELDRAILAYRDNPTPENKARVQAAATQHTAAFHAEQTGTSFSRT